MWYLDVDDANTTTSNGTGVVSVAEEGNVDISCSSTGVPIPAVSWTYNNQPTTFAATDSSTDHSIRVLSGGSFEVTPGRVVSTLHIVNAQYPSNEGVYVCTGSNTYDGVTTTSSATVSVQILGNNIACHAK
jgi:hypothetical protein